MKTKYLLWALPFMASSLCAQRAVEIAEGYYTMSPFEKSSQSYVYSYDTDALRAPYGNAADYDHPCGRNGEVAYLYCVPTTSVALANSAYYFNWPVVAIRCRVCRARHIPIWVWQAMTGI